MASSYFQEINFIRPKISNNLINKEINIISLSPINSLKCQNCLHNSFNENIEIDINNNMTDLFSQIDKDDFYILVIYLLFGLDGNNCFFSKLFNYKYPCSLLKKIIFFCHNPKNLYIINQYLIESTNNVQASYPSIINADIREQFLIPKPIYRLNFETKEEKNMAMEEIKNKYIQDNIFIVPFININIFYFVFFFSFINNYLGIFTYYIFSEFWP